MEKIKKVAPKKLKSIKSGKKTIPQVKRELKKSDKPKSPKSNRRKRKFMYGLDIKGHYITGSKARNFFSDDSFETMEEAFNTAITKVNEIAVKKKRDLWITFDIYAVFTLPGDYYCSYQQIYHRHHLCENNKLKILNEKKSKQYISEIEKMINTNHFEIRVYKDIIARLSLENKLPDQTEAAKYG